jgi:LuxR family maltose regulon positive regulatory protein
LGRFTPEQCDAVLGREDSAAMLANLARSNMFLVALDAREGWYRYHHLFGEVLQLELGAQAARELRRKAAAWARAHGLVEDAIEYAAAAGDAEAVAEMLVEHHLTFIWGGRVRQLFGWIQWLPADLLVDHPLLPVSGAAAAALLARPELETEQLLAVAERTRQERAHLWSPYAEAAVELVRAEMIKRGDVGSAVEHGRRAVAAALAGAEPLIVSSLATLSHALFFAGDLDESRRVAEQAVGNPGAPDAPDAYVGSLGLLALIDAERGRTESAEAWARQAIGIARDRFQADSWVASMAHLGSALACAATGRLDEAERGALRGELLRRSPQPTVGHAHALLVLARVRIVRSRLARAAGDLTRAQRAIAEFRDPGRLPAIAAEIERDLAEARSSAGRRPPVEEPSPAELAVLRGLGAGLSRREIGNELYISLNTVKTHTRELYRKLGVTSRADAIARASALGLLDNEQPPE